MGKKKIVEKTQEEPSKETKTSPKAQREAASETKTARRIASGRIYIRASYNNTGVTVTDEEGKVLAWATAGALGFGGPKKATPFAASKIVAAISEKISKSGPLDVHVYVAGVGPGRDSAIRSLVNQGFNVLSIRDVTPIPHNGPKPKKVRRM
ncbi:MAG: 30S ribosomal protein S11 [Candidatus Colwellbacteria bacterium]|nr:30S ribosomal protein S11 [Candidatus Colwellbacteria bacterium]